MKFRWDPPERKAKLFNRVGAFAAGVRFSFPPPLGSHQDIALINSRTTQAKVENTL
jgi:hypothetical protein